jgi:hypothetical protein
MTGCCNTEIEAEAWLAVSNTAPHTAVSTSPKYLSFMVSP